MICVTITNTSLRPYSVISPGNGLRNLNAIIKLITMVSNVELA